MEGGVDDNGDESERERFVGTGVDSRTPPPRGGVEPGAVRRVSDGRPLRVVGAPVGSGVGGNNGEGLDGFGVWQTSQAKRSGGF